MKVGNLVNGLAVVDVKRINKMNLIQFTKAVSEYIEQGYKIDVHSSRQVGLVLQCDVFKLESNVGEGVGETEETVATVDTSTENVVDDSKGSEPYNPENVVLKINDVEVEGFNTEKVDEGAVSSETEVEETTPPVKKTRTKKTT